MNENLPDYLSKGSKCFEEAMNHISSSTTMIEDLRQMAVLIYHLFIINLEKSLWLTYMKAGTDKFNSNQVKNDNNNNKIDRCIWPIEVQTTMKKSIKNNNHDNNTNCLTFATQYLSDLENKIKNYETQLNIAKNRLREHLQTIELFIQQKLESFRLRIVHQIELVQYNYNDRMLELQYLQYNPTPRQVSFTKDVLLYFYVHLFIYLFIYFLFCLETNCQSIESCKISRSYNQRRI